MAISRVLFLIMGGTSLAVLGWADRSLAAGADCSALAKRLSSKATIVSSSQMVVDDAQLPPFCLLKGATAKRSGEDGRNYAITFELRLPAAWNGRLLHQVNGGNDGVVVPALGDARNANAVRDLTALARGFAVISSDSGHNGADPDNKAAGLAAGAAFGFDPQARSDYGYAANATVVTFAKQAIEVHYGEAPRHSYMMGCSNGGRHAMIAASRYAQHYDGIVAGNPGFNLPRAAIQHAWDVQAFRAVDVDMKKALTREDMTLVSAKVLEKCDALDGVADGLVQDIKACQATFKVDDLACASGQNQCLPANKLTALKKIMAGPSNSKGEKLYANWSYDPGMSGADWRMWKLESPIPAWGQQPIIAVMGSSSLAQIFTTPPTPVAGEPVALIDYLSRYDFDRDAPKIFAKGSGKVNDRTVAYHQSAMDFMTPPDVDNPKLAAFKRKGGKMLVYHGVADGVFSFNDTAAWYDKLNANHSGEASRFVRLFPVPGMNHCRGGPATDQFDMLGAIVAWTERGVAPDRILASVRAANRDVPADWGKERSRPLCPWPKVARYTSGDKEQASSFECR